MKFSLMFQELTELHHENVVALLDCKVIEFNERVRDIVPVCALDINFLKKLAVFQREHKKPSILLERAQLI